MALQTREQHIKRASATSNICTAQALLANMASFYCVYHGPTGLTEIADRIHNAARAFALGVEMVGHTVVNKNAFFDAVTVKLSGITSNDFVAKCEDRRINVWRVSDDTVSLAFDEATTEEHLAALLESAGMEGPKLDVVREMASKAGAEALGFSADLARTTTFLQQPVFNDFHSESDLMRYIWKLQRKDYGLQDGMVPLGSCTMKLNPAASMLPMSWQRVTAIHPFVPAAQAEGYKLLATELVQRLKEVSGLDAVSLQPNSGAQGEYAGIRTIRAYQQSIGEGHRNIVLTMANAHGTNPATVAVSGMKPVVVNCDKSGATDIAHLKQLCEKHGKDIAAAMITYPSTYGMFDTEIKTMTDLVHSVGGQVYIDGANFNAMLGYTGPGFFGGDVCHFNLHKTFSIPHGGGGPGMGPIACKEHLSPFLPRGPHDHIYTVGGSKSFGPVSQAPLGSASILTISYMLMTMLGNDGVKNCSEFAVLASNYLRASLAADYHVRYVCKESQLSAHEFIVDMQPFAAAGVKAEDVAKRLMDYGFHAPTLAFPVNNTLMVEPTESEPKRELDRFIAAMKAVRNEIRKIESGEWPKDDNPLKNAPHPAEDLAFGEWAHPYSREVAAYPMGADSVTGQLKFWPTTSRVNNEHGDQHLFCSCGPAPTAEE
jgi:glycine dehydrogenase